MMDIIQIYIQFPTRNDCITHIEKCRWNQKPSCPYCHSQKCTPIKNEHRYHCNGCNTPYSVTVRTIFHKTHVDLQKWFLAIYIMMNTRTNISVRQLAYEIRVNKNTAWQMIKRIQIAILKERELLERLIKFDSQNHLE
jgi:transposase-like protein